MMVFDEGDSAFLQLPVTRDRVQIVLERLGHLASLGWANGKTP